MMKSSQQNNRNKTIKNRKRRRNASQNRSANNALMLNKPGIRPIRIGLPRRMLSECGMNYLKALYSPFGTFTSPPCVPSLISLPSYKFNSFARGSFEIGTMGVGFVIFNPCNVLNTLSNGTVTSTSGAGWYTDRTFLGTSTAYPATTGINNFSTSSSALASFATSPADSLFTRQYRIVGASIRVRFTGNQLNSNGEVICYREEGNVGILTGIDQDYLLSQVRTVRYTTQMTTDKWAEVLYFPDNPTLLGFNTVGNLNGITPFGLGQLIIFVDGGFPTSTFQYEVTGWYEAIGSSWPSITRSESDPAALGAIISAAPIQVDKTQPGIMAKIVKKAIQSLPTTDRFIDITGNLVGTAARSYFRGTNAYEGIGPPREPSVGYSRSQMLNIEDMDMVD